MEHTREEKRHYWLIIINSIIRKLKENNPECKYDFSIREKVFLLLAVRRFKENFFNKSDLDPIFKQLELSTKGRRMNLKKYIDKKNS